MIQVICTGKGTHRVAEMRSFDHSRVLNANMGDDGIRWWKDYDGWLEIDGRTHTARPLKDPYTFRCRRCGRETRMTAKTLRTALDGLHEAGRDAGAYNPLDVSRLHF